PTVVRTGLQHVDLVAAVRAVLALPDLPRAWMHREPDGAAMAAREDLGRGLVAADERIVVGNLAVRREPQGVAAERRVEHAVGPADAARRAAASEVNALAADERPADVAAARDREPATAPAAAAASAVLGRTRLRIREIAEPVRREVGMQGEIEESRGNTAGRGLRH